MLKYELIRDINARFMRIIQSYVLKDLICFLFLLYQNGVTCWAIESVKLLHLNTTQYDERPTLLKKWLIDASNSFYQGVMLK